MASLLTCFDRFSSAMEREQVEEREREQQQLLLNEQNAAYLESLAADRAKEEQRRKEEVAKMRETEKALRQEEDAAKYRNDMMKSFTDSLQPEPDEKFKGDVTNVRIRTPANETVTRKFAADSHLDQLHSFVGSMGFFPESHRIMTSWPRKELSYEERSATFRDKQLIPTATLVVEKRIS